MSSAVDSVAVAVSPSKHCTPNRSLNTYDSNQINFIHTVSDTVKIVGVLYRNPECDPWTSNSASREKP